MNASLRAHSAALLGTLAILLVLIATWKLTIANRIIARGDLLLYFYPLRDYASAAIRQGHLPLWNPFTFMGAPFIANSQVGFFYPLNVMLAWLPVGHAVSWSIVLHLAIAALGMFALARRGLRLGSLASLAGAVTFGLGGYLGAQVEHLNQLQVLAWLPLEMLLIRADPQNCWGYVRRCASLALLITLQVLAGHTQSLYICLVAMAIVAVVQLAIGIAPYLRTRVRSPVADEASNAGGTSGVRTLIAPLLLIISAGLLAATMSGVQLLPTAELATQSARSGGLSFNEIGAFSWRPWVAARALLPTYGDPLFPEYVTYLGTNGLALAVLGALAVFQQRAPNGRTRPQFTVVRHEATYYVVAIILTMTGALLAFGVATPLFGVLYRIMPGFNLFRAQTRWLIVFALGASMLTAMGVQALRNGLSGRLGRSWLLGWCVLLGLVIIGLVVGVRISPEAEYRTIPAFPTLLGWIVGFVVASIAILVYLTPLRARLLTHSSGAATLFTLLLIVELTAASQFQPYARASDEESLTDLRPSTAHLMAGAALDIGNIDQSQRILALSGLFFDPGDLPEQTLIYQSQLSADELYDRVIASKQKEILSPNLSLYYRLPSVDGYDGGLLPLKRYADFVQQFIPGASQDNSATNGPRSIDGRLREFLPAVPADIWLQRMAVRYVVADKTHDTFIDNVYYDLQFAEPLSDTFSQRLDRFESTTLGIVLSAPDQKPGDMLLHAMVDFMDGTAQSFDVRGTDAITQPYFPIRFHWTGRGVPVQVTLVPAVRHVTLDGLTSIDEDAEAYMSQPIRGDHDMQLVHSGDVKIYENMRPAPRVFLAPLAEFSMINGQLQMHRLPLDISSNPVSITQDAPERLGLDVQADISGWLVVRDAFYPGWVARVDGVEQPITVVDSLFRAVQVLPGKHQVVFSYEPQSVRLGAGLSVAGLMAWIALLAVGFWRGRWAT